MGMGHDDEGTGTALVPSDGGDKAPEFSREELALIDNADTAQTTVPVTGGADAARLAEIRALRKADPNRYWSDPIQKEEQNLIRAMSAPADPTGQATGDGADLAAVQKRISEIKALSKSDPKKYWSDAVQKEELALHTQLIEMKEEAQQTAHMKGVVDSVLSAVANPAAFEAGFNDMFAALPEQSQAIVRQVIATPIDPTRPANAAAVERFAAGSPEQAELIREWGRNAGRRFAIMKERLDGLMGAGEQLAEWFDSLPAAEAKAIMKALSA